MHYFSGKGCSESLESMHYCIGILKNGAITEKTITVTVKEKVTNKPVSPQQPQKPSKPTTPTKPSGQKNPVKTGDMTNVGLFTSMFAGSTGVLAVLLTTKTYPGGLLHDPSTFYTEKRRDSKHY